eukprot:1847679-Rhodomonas_salina.7
MPSTNLGYNGTAISIVLRDAWCVMSGADLGCTCTAIVLCDVWSWSSRYCNASDHPMPLLSLSSYALDMPCPALVLTLAMLLPAITCRSPRFTIERPTVLLRDTRLDA